MCMLMRLQVRFQYLSKFFRISQLFGPPNHALTLTRLPLRSSLLNFAQNLKGGQAGGLTKSPGRLRNCYVAENQLKSVCELMKIFYFPIRKNAISSIKVNRNQDVDPSQIPIFFMPSSA